jgi:hypothetical protein
MMGVLAVMHSHELTSAWKHGSDSLNSGAEFTPKIWNTKSHGRIQLCVVTQRTHGKQHISFLVGSTIKLSNNSAIFLLLKNTETDP